MGSSSFLDSASFGAAGCKSPGFPESLTVLPRLSMHSSGHPESCIFRLFRQWVFEFPRIPHPSAPPPPNLQVSPSIQLQASPCGESSGFPSSSPSGCRRWLFEFPRVPHPSVSPSSNLQVAPALRLKLRLSMDSPGLPGSSIFRLRRRWFFEFPRITHPSAALAAKAPGFPESLFLQHRLLMSLRVSPDTASSGCADGEFPGIPDSRSIGCAVWLIPGSPRLPFPTAAPSMRIQASMNPAYTVGSMMTPWVESNFASSC